MSQRWTILRTASYCTNRTLGFLLDTGVELLVLEKKFEIVGVYRQGV